MTQPDATIAAASARVLLLGLETPGDIAGIASAFRHGLLGLGVLLLCRPVALPVLWPILGGGLTRCDRAFLAWLGPVGVAATNYALHATERTGETLIREAASLVVPPPFLPMASRPSPVSWPTGGA